MCQPTFAGVELKDRRRKTRPEVLDDGETITFCAEELRESLGTSDLTGSRAFIHTCVSQVAGAPGAAQSRESS